jgi:hypothetical protein
MTGTCSMQGVNYKVEKHVFFSKFKGIITFRTGSVGDWRACIYLISFHVYLTRLSVFRRLYGVERADDRSRATPLTQSNHRNQSNQSPYVMRKSSSIVTVETWYSKSGKYVRRVKLAQGYYIYRK